MNLTRRDIGKLALAALPAATLRAAKPNSVFGGVQVGINAPYSFHNIPGGADDILGYMTRLNLSAAERGDRCCPRLAARGRIPGRLNACPTWWRRRFRLRCRPSTTSATGC